MFNTNYQFQDKVSCIVKWVYTVHTHCARININENTLQAMHNKYDGNQILYSNYLTTHTSHLLLRLYPH